VLHQPKQVVVCGRLVQVSGQVLAGLVTLVQRRHQVLGVAVLVVQLCRSLVVGSVLGCAQVLQVLHLVGVGVGVGVVSEK